jgi:tripartite-type tricarboxylate transporter receptor subunit TctC
LAVAPNIPTMDEFGLKNFNASYWNGIFGPKGLPPAIVDRLAQAFNKVMAQPDIQAKLVPTAIEVDSTSTPAQFAKMIKDDYATWAEAVRFANIQAQ